MIRLLSGLDEGRIGKDIHLAPSEAATQITLPSELTIYQQQAYRFLVEKGINKRFVLEKILSHPKVNYAPLRGYEDIYIRVVWNFFASKTKSVQKAGAFVSWWKNGRLTEDGLHAHMVETVLGRGKVLNQKERDERAEVARWKREEVKIFDNFGWRSKTLNNFNIGEFRKDHPKIYQHFVEQIEKGYRQTLEASQQDFDFNKYQKSIEHQVYHKCKDWLQNAQ